MKERKRTINGAKKERREKKIEERCSEGQRRTQKRAAESVPFAFIRGLRGHSTYILLPVSLCLPLFLLQCVNLPTSLLPRFFSTSFAAILSVSLHVRADYALSSRNYFAYMLSPFALSLSIFLPFATIHPHPSADRPSPFSSAPAALSPGLL